MRGQRHTPPAAATEGLLTVEQAAERASYERTTIYRAIYAGDLKAKKISGRWWVREAELDRWLGALHRELERYAAGSKS